MLGTKGRDTGLNQTSHRLQRPLGFPNKSVRQSTPIYLCNNFRVHGPVVVEALGPPGCHSFPDLRAVYPVLQRRVSADRIEAAVATDGAFIWNVLRKTLAHNGLR